MDQKRLEKIKKVMEAIGELQPDFTRLGEYQDVITMLQSSLINDSDANFEETLKIFAVKMKQIKDKK